MTFSDFKDKYQKKEVEEFPNQVPNDIKVSVCVQTYQHGNFLEDCLNSILAQKTDFNFEILLGEDDSTDGTREICLDFAKKYPTIIRLFLHKRENNMKINGKPTGRFNFYYNLYSAKGDYLAFCEGDDYWIDDNKLQKQANFLDKNPDYNLVCHNVKEKKDNKLFSKRSTTNYTQGKYLLYKNFIPTLSVMYRWNFSVNNLPSYLLKTPMGDLQLHYFSAKNSKINKMRANMGVRRVHKGGIWSQLDSIKLYDNGILAREIMRPSIQDDHLPFLNAGINRLQLNKFITKKIMNENFEMKLLKNDFRIKFHNFIYIIAKKTNNKVLLKSLIKLINNV